MSVTDKQHAQGRLQEWITEIRCTRELKKGSKSYHDSRSTPGPGLSRVGKHSVESGLHRGKQCPVHLRSASGKSDLC
jgi:hypothetical protein